MKKRFLFTSFILLTLVLLIAFSVSAKGSFRPVLVLEAESGVLGGPAVVRGEKVGNVGCCGGAVEGTITFYDLEVPEDGIYTMCVYYYSGSDDRYFVFTVDGVETRLDCPSTGSFDTVGTILLDIELKKGATLKIGTDWYGPDLDKIQIYEQGAFDFVGREYNYPDHETVHAGKYVVLFDVDDDVLDESLVDKSKKVVKESDTIDSPEYRIERYEMDLPDLMNTIHDAYMFGKVSAHQYAEALKAAYDALDNVEISKD